MKRKFERIAETFTFFALTILNLSATCWAGPPGPPNLSHPATPVGGTEITIATAVAIAGYGYWKSRK
jgi:hypothetical protein